jgi:putative sigma-54 modulation protein
MQTNISGHHLALTPALRAYVNKITNRLDASFSGITNTQVTLTKENIQYIAELMLHMRGVDIKATSMNKDMYAAIDRLHEKVIKQILKFKGKKRKLRHKSVNDDLNQDIDKENDPN